MVIVVVFFLLGLRDGVEFDLVKNGGYLVSSRVIVIVIVTVIVIGIANDNNGADAVVDAVITDASETRFGGAFGGRAKATAAHDDSAEA